MPSPDAVHVLVKLSYRIDIFYHPFQCGNIMIEIFCYSSFFRNTKYTVIFVNIGMTRDWLEK